MWLPHGHKFFQQECVPLFHCEPYWVQWAVILDISDDLEEARRIVWGEAWVWQAGVSLYMISEQPGTVQGLLVVLLAAVSKKVEMR